MILLVSAGSTPVSSVSYDGAVAILKSRKNTTRATMRPPARPILAVGVAFLMRGTRLFMRGMGAA